MGRGEAGVGEAVAVFDQLFFDHPAVGHVDVAEQPAVAVAVLVGGVGF